MIYYGIYFGYLKRLGNMKEVNMQILLVLKSKKTEGDRVIVNVRAKSLKEKLTSLLSEDKDREAFDLLVKEAQVEAYLPPGKKARIRPDLTLIEDLL